MSLRPEILKGVKTVHFIGIGGIGMCGLAEYLIDNGMKVSGSDMVGTKITKRLELKGAKIYYGHKEENIDKKINLCVYTSAVKKDNPEYKQAKAYGIKMMKRAELLGCIVNDKFLIAIAGTHGKTTTTSMIAKIFIDAGLDPLVFVGGNLDFLKNSAYRNGKSEIAIVEADEYDRSFHTLKPDIALINNIELDHTDIYNNKKDILESFLKFINKVKKSGFIVINSDDKNAKVITRKLRNKKLIIFGSNAPNIIKIEKGSTNIFNLNEHKINLRTPGIHNMYNAAGAIITASLAGIDINKIKKSIESFNGVQRRLQLKYENDFIIYDDYAHHPTEVKYSLETLKKMYKKVTVVFQPHTFSRTKEFYKEFAKSLSIADKIILMPVYPAREEPIKGVSSGLILKNIKQKKGGSKLLNSNPEIYENIKNNFKKGNCIVFQGAGTISNFCDDVIKQIKKDKK